MSIYATFFEIADQRLEAEDMAEAGINYGFIDEDGEVEDLDTLPPEMLDAPIAYGGSHILPHESDPRGGSVQLALIPSHIQRPDRGDGQEDGPPWPYLRLDVADSDGVATVVLTSGQVERFRDGLSEWLAMEGESDE